MPVFQQNLGHSFFSFPFLSDVCLSLILCNQLFTNFTISHYKWQVRNTNSSGIFICPYQFTLILMLAIGLMCLKTNKLTNEQNKICFFLVYPVSVTHFLKLSFASQNQILIKPIHVKLKILIHIETVVPMFFNYFYILFLILQVNLSISGIIHRN